MMATQTASTSVQISFHQRMASLLHDHQTWAALASVVVLLAKYLFNLNVSGTEVLSFVGIMAAWLFGSAWVAKAHIDAMAQLGTQAAVAATTASSRQPSAGNSQPAAQQ